MAEAEEVGLGEMEQMVVAVVQGEKSGLLITHSRMPIRLQ